MLQIILDNLLLWFAPILSFTTEEIYCLLNKERNESVHLQNFNDIPEKWNNKEIFEKWKQIIKIRETSNISIEKLRSSKEIGSSLESQINIKLNKKYYEISKSFDFSELCITSGAKVELIDNLKDEIVVDAYKATGKKCKVCWKIFKEKCNRHGCQWV